MHTAHQRVNRKHDLKMAVVKQHPPNDQPLKETQQSASNSEFNWLIEAMMTDKQAQNNETFSLRWKETALDISSGRHDYIRSESAGGGRRRSV